MLGTKTVARAVVFGAGYVLGARAGRERYEEIRKWSQEKSQSLRQQYAQARAESADTRARPNGDHTNTFEDNTDLADISLGGQS